MGWKQRTQVIIFTKILFFRQRDNEIFLGGHIQCVRTNFITASAPIPNALASAIIKCSLLTYSLKKIFSL